MAGERAGHSLQATALVNELRNQASVAHPNKDVLGPEEAMIAINATRTIFGYLNSKL